MKRAAAVLAAIALLGGGCTAGAVAVLAPPGAAQATAALTAGQYWYIRFSCQGR